MVSNASLNGDCSAFRWHRRVILIAAFGVAIPLAAGAWAMTGRDVGLGLGRIQPLNTSCADGATNCSSMMAAERLNSTNPFGPALRGISGEPREEELGGCLETSTKPPWVGRLENEADNSATLLAAEGPIVQRPVYVRSPGDNPMVQRRRMLAILLTLDALGAMQHKGG